MVGTGLRAPRIGAPLRALRERTSPALLVALTLALLILGKLDLRLAVMVGNGLRDALVPVLAVVQRPADQIRHGIGELADLVTARAENRRLREENRRLLGRDAEAAWLADEN